MTGNGFFQYSYSLRKINIPGGKALRTIRLFGTLLLHDLPDRSQYRVDFLIGIGADFCTQNGTLADLPALKGTHAGDESFEDVTMGLVQWCRGSGRFRQYAGYDAARHGPALAPLQSACDVLTGAAADLGDVADTAAWREKVGQALRVLQS